MTLKDCLLNERPIALARHAFLEEDHLPLLTNAPEHPSQEETSDTLIETVLHDPNLVERIAALTQLKEYMNEDLRVRAILEQVAQSDSASEVQKAATALLSNQ